MALKIEEAKIIDGFDWDKLVQETYGRPYCFQQQEGCRGKGFVLIEVLAETYDEFEDVLSIPEKVNGRKMGVNFQKWLERDPKQPLKNQEDSESLTFWWHRNFYPDIRMVANDLYKKGLIPEGEYYIDIYW